MTDEELVKLCKIGEESAFERLIEKYHVPIYNYIYNLAKDKQLSEDLVQETFIKMINNIGKYNFMTGTKFSTWLFTVAKNTLNDEFRKSKFKNSISLDEVSGINIQSRENVESKAIINEELNNVNQAICDLPNEAKSMVYLRYYMDLSYKDISEVLQCSQTRVKWQLHQSIEKVRKILLKEVKIDET